MSTETEDRTEFLTWLEAQEDVRPDIFESVLQELPRLGFISQIPPELDFLGQRGSFVDLGFKYLPLSKPDLRAILLALVGRGVVLPGTQWRLRVLSAMRGVVEPVDGNEQVTLPTNWKQGVMVSGTNNKLSWVGKLFPHDRLEDLSNYQDVGDGLVPQTQRNDG